MRDRPGTERVERRPVADQLARAAGVASIRAPSSPNTATGSTQAASSRRTRCASERSGPLRSSRGDQHRRRAVGKRERARRRRSSDPAHPGAKSAQPFEPRGAIGRQRRRKARDLGGGRLCARVKCAHRQAPPASARRKSRRRWGSPTTRCVASGDHSQAGDGLSASGVRRGSCNQSNQSSPTVAPGSGPACGILNGFLVVGGLDGVHDRPRQDLLKRG